MNFDAGTVLGKYVIRGPLGKGGMSDVFLAHDNENDRDVVLKFPHADLMGDPKTHEHFNREVKIGKLLDHPNIQKLYELGGDVRDPFLVLEFVPGITLRDEIANRENARNSSRGLFQNTDAADMQQRVAEAQTVGCQLAHALSYAHEHHVAHRDLKPENVIVTPDGHAKVMDFGVAYIEGARRVTWGAFSAQVGTPDYMAPEQIKGVRGDHRTDIYAVGMMLYEIIATRLPYEGDNALAIMSQHVNENAPPLSEFCKGVPPAIEEIVMKAIRRNPDDRFQTMTEFADALEHPETVDPEAMRISRDGERASGPRLKGIALEIGMPIWKVMLIVGCIFAAIILIGVSAQYVNHAR